MKKKDVIIISAVMLIAIWSNIAIFSRKDTKELKLENAKLKAQIKALTQENLQLKETEEGAFNAAMDFFGKATQKKEWEQVEIDFTRFLNKFPSSAHADQILKSKKECAEKIAKITMVENKVNSIHENIARANWTKAKNTLKEVQPNLTVQEYNQLKEKIENEQFKPLQTTVNNIVSSPNEYNGKKVEVTVALHSHVDRANKELMGYGIKCAGGSKIDISYAKTSAQTIQWFTDNDPDCWKEQYNVVGVIALDYYQNPYIKAEKIERR